MVNAERRAASHLTDYRRAHLSWREKWYVLSELTPSLLWICPLHSACANTTIWWTYKIPDFLTCCLWVRDPLYGKEVSQWIHDHGFCGLYCILHLLEAAGLIGHWHGLINIKSLAQEPCSSWKAIIQDAYIHKTKTADRYDLVPQRARIYESGNEDVEIILAFLTLSPSDLTAEFLLPILLLEVLISMEELFHQGA